MPTTTAMSATGMRLYRISTSMTAEIATPSQSWPPISRMPSAPSDSPRPSCSPAAIVGGNTRAIRLTIPVTPMRRKKAPIASPAPAIAPGFIGSINTAADAAFIGCTAIGTP